MTLQAPKLDSRTFDELVKEARDRIPRFTPEWTNLNDADPGMTLVKLQAWLTETLLYEMNRLPEFNYIKFLQLLNVTPEPARAARTELHFTLKKLDGESDPLKFFIPKNAQVQADDPDLTTPLVFETDRTLTALNASVAAVIASNDADSAQPRSLVSSFDAKTAITTINHSFYPFGETPVENAHCLIGILLRPHRKQGVDYSQDVFPTGELDLSVSAVEVFEKDELGNPVEGPVARQGLLPYEIGAAQDLLIWEVYVGSNHGSEFTDTSGNDDAWERLHPPLDETAALSRSGHLRPSLPEDISQLGLHKLAREFWGELGLKKPPTSGSELYDDLANLDGALSFDIDTAKDIPWEDIVPAANLADVTGACEDIAQLLGILDPIKADLKLDAIDPRMWIDLDVGYGDPAVPEHAMAWIRVRINESVSGDDRYEPKLLNGFFLNTVSATAAVTRVEEVLGTSDGRPAQQLRLDKFPVYVAPESGQADIEIDVTEAGNSVTWSLVGDFYGTDSHSEVFLLDESSGTLTFGDGIYGRIPVAGSTIVARRYRYGGGGEGNVGAHTVTKIKTSLQQVDAVTNPRAAVGGSEAESLQNVKLRAPHDLKTRDRAVTAEDFAFLAKQTPEVPVHTAYALARTAIDLESGDLVAADGAVTVVILPNNRKQETPQPNEAQLDAVCAYLNDRRLITTELYVTGPRYLPVTRFEVEIRAQQNADLQALSDSVYQQLLNFFHPLYGGAEGSGWPFGEDVFLGSIYELLLGISGVSRAVGLSVELEGVSAVDCQDALTVPDGHLLHLSRDVIQLKVVYDNG